LPVALTDLFYLGFISGAPLLHRGRARRTFRRPAKTLRADVDSFLAKIRAA
jgi:hypothetical protein